MQYASFYLTMLDELKRMNDTNFGRLVRALMEYAETGIEPENIDDIGVYFDIYKGKIDIQREAHEKKQSTQSENAKKRWHKNDVQSDSAEQTAMQNDAAGCDGMPRHATECQEMPSDAYKTITITNKEESISKDIPKKKVGFQPPTLLEVEQYFTEKGFSIDPKTFFDYFSEGDWKDSQGNAVKSWKQKAITWNSKQIPIPRRKAMGGNAPYKQTKLPESEFDAMFTDLNEDIV